MVFFIEDDHLIEKCNTICDKVSADIYIKKEFDNESVYNKEYLKKKKKILCWWSYRFYAKEIPKVGSNYNYLVVISLDSALKEDEN